MDELIFGIAGFVVVAVLAISGGMAFDYIACSSKARAMHIPYTWGPMQGCIVEVKGAYVPIDNVGVRTIDEVRP